MKLLTAYRFENEFEVMIILKQHNVSILFMGLVCRLSTDGGGEIMLIHICKEGAFFLTKKKKLPLLFSKYFLLLLWDYFSFGVFCLRVFFSFFGFKYWNCGGFVAVFPLWFFHSCTKLSFWYINTQESGQFSGTTQVDPILYSNRLLIWIMSR